MFVAVVMLLLLPCDYWHTYNHIVIVITYQVYWYLIILYLLTNMIHSMIFAFKNSLLYSCLK